MRRSLPWVVFLITSLLPIRGLGQDASSDDAARRHFESGRAYFDRAQYDAAVREFEEAYRLSHRKELLVNVSRAYEAAGHVDRAIAALEQWLAVADANDPLRADMEARIVRLRLHSESVAAQREAEAQRAREAEAAEAASRPPESTPAPAARVEAAPESSPNPARIVLLGAGAAAAGVGAVFLALGYGDIHTVENPAAGSTWSSSADEYDRAPTRVGLGYGLVGLGVASCVVGLVVRGGSDDDAPVAVHVSPTGLSVRGSF